MKRDKRVVMSIIWLVIGAALIALSFTGKVDSFWNGMGFGLTTVGGLQLLRFYRFQKDERYREKMEIEEADERNHFIRGKAWAWAGYLFILTASVFVIVLRIMKQDLLSTAAAFAVCVMLMFYWCAYHILKRKY